MIGIGIGVGLTPHRPTVPASGSNPNLLVFPEAFDNAAWVKSGAVVTADIGDSTHATADQIGFSGGSVRQTSGTAAIAGTGLRTATMTPAWVRYSLTVTVDGLPYTLSVELKDPASSDLSLRLDVTGGFIRASLVDLGDNPTVRAWGAKLEQAAAFSGYP